MEELIQFLSPTARVDVKMLAMQQILGLTGTPEGISTISSCPSLLSTLVNLLSDPPVSIDASLAMINLSTDPTTTSHLLSLTPVPTLVKTISNKDLGDKMASILSNMTRETSNSNSVYQQMITANITISSIVDLLCTAGTSLHYLGPFLSNLSQISEVRRDLMDKETNLFGRLLPFTQYQGSVVRRGGIVAVIRNCCLSTSDHEWLLDDDLNLLSHMLLPLAGPTPEDWADDEVEKLPMDLQYLDEDKKVESDDDIRKMLLEGLNQLCATRNGREMFRSRNVYLILRELHQRDANREVRLAAENIIDILIKTEEEINIDNYKEVEVPENMHEKFQHMDAQYLS